MSNLEVFDIIIDHGERQFVADSWTWEEITGIFNQLPNHPDYQGELSIGRQLLSRMNWDSESEFMKLVQYNNGEIGQRQLLSLLIMNTFNIADSRVESGECFGVDDKRAFQGFSFNEAISAIEKLAELTGQDLGDFHQRVAGIVDEQLKGMELMQESKQAGKITYSVDQALEYRRKTVGKYYQLLAEIGIDSLEQRNSFVARFSEWQVDDDKIDISEDLDTQVNPFLAILAERGLEQLLRERISKSTRGFGYSTFIKNSLISEDLRQELYKRADEVSSSYLEF